MNKCHADNGISQHCTLCYGWQWVMFGLQAALWCVLRYPPTTMEMLTHPTNNWILFADAFINLWCVQCSQFHVISTKHWTERVLAQLLRADIPLAAPVWPCFKDHQSCQQSWYNKKCIRRCTIFCYKSEIGERLTTSNTSLPLEIQPLDWIT